MVPAIAFTIPDLDGMAQLQLMAKNTGAQVACIQSSVDNGKTFSTPAVPGIAAGIAGGALLVSGISAIMSGGHPGTSTSSPTFFDVMSWFQSMALNGMLSVDYPPVYRSFSKNFAFSGLLIPWNGMQDSIDNFRKATGGNLTDNSVQYLQNNVTLVYQNSNTTISKRGLSLLNLITRAVTTSIGNNTQPATQNSKVMQQVHGIEAYVEPLLIPKSNTFMTVLIVFSIIIAAIIVAILLFKVILEAWALFGRFPKRLLGFRERYWWVMAKSITSLILLLYGTW
jgi:Transient receptor potential (TRP) ion channel/ML-like domain